MANRKRKSAKRKKKQNKQKKHNRLKLKYLFFIVFFICFAVYVLLLDTRIRNEFEGKKWNIPALVYAQPIEIYLGQSISRNQLIRQLDDLGYVKSQYLKHPGRYKLSGSNKLDITSRAFRFWDGLEQQKSFRITFSAGLISNIIGINNQEQLPIVRFEPKLIGKIYPRHNEDRVLVTLSETPKYLVDGLIAVEDKRFYEHVGIDPVGILRAMISNIRHGSFKQGGSTLTQQLVKNFFLSHEKTFRRKFNEFIMALLLEYHYSKDQILEAYINEVYLGQNGARGIHGFGTAAEFYFAKPLTELNHAEVALLVGIVKGASYYNPRKHPTRALERRNLVLQQMQQQGFISNKIYDSEIKKWLGVTKQRPDWSGSEYTAFLDYLKKQISEFYTDEQLRNEGLKIFTTLVPEYQRTAQKTIQKRLSRLEKAYGITANSLQAGLVLTTTDTGEVLAVVGGRNPGDIGFNRAVTAQRPIGSLIKPAIYLTALKEHNKFNVLSTVEDLPVRIKQHDGTFWQPHNYDKKIHGAVPMYEALSQSYNLAAIHLGMKLGIENIITTMKKMGVTKNIPPYHSIFLGALDLSVMDVTQMYQTLASNGFRVPLNSIRAVMDKNGNILQRKPIRVIKSLDDKAVYLTQSLLMNVINSGTAMSIRDRFQQQLPLAGKTGTTNNLRDSWFAGYGSNLLSVVWIGRDDNKTANLTGASGALQVWADLMSDLPIEPLNLKTPNGIVLKNVPSKILGCKKQLGLPFVESALPSSAEFCQ